MQTGDLCHIIGYLDTGRITAIRDDRVTVELAEGILEVHESAITRTWAPSDECGGKYWPGTSIFVEEEDDA